MSDINLTYRLYNKRKEIIQQWGVFRTHSNIILDGAFCENKLFSQKP